MNIDPSLLSLTVIYTMQAASMLALGIRYLVMVDAGFVSVERMLSMVEIGQESGRKSLPSDPDLATWPSNGKISIRDLTFQYKPTLPLVLKSISFDVKSGERIGVTKIIMIQKTCNLRSVAERGRENRLCSFAFYSFSDARLLPVSKLMELRYHQF